MRSACRLMSSPVVGTGHIGIIARTVCDYRMLQYCVCIPTNVGAIGVYMLPIFSIAFPDVTDSPIVCRSAATLS